LRHSVYTASPLFGGPSDFCLSRLYNILSDLTERAISPIYDRFTGGVFTNLLYLSASPYLR